MTKFTKDEVQAVSKDINAALRVISEKYGISIRAGAISYSAAQLTCKIAASTTEKPELVVGANLIGRKFKNGGNNVYTIIEMPNSDTVTLQTQRGTKYSGSIASLDNVVWID